MIVIVLLLPNATLQDVTLMREEKVSALDYLATRVYPTLLPGLEALLQDMRPSIERTVTELVEEDDAKSGLQFLAEVTLFVMI